MVLDSSQERKVYEGILLQIHEIVQERNLRPGDKLPSERELSEQLGAGRSSVREALRALELLGLIETRRGEGTFLKSYRHNRLIDILGFFILRDAKTKKDLIEIAESWSWTRCGSPADEQLTSTLKRWNAFWRLPRNGSSGGKYPRKKTTCSIASFAAPAAIRSCIGSGHLLSNTATVFASSHCHARAGQRWLLGSIARSWKRSAQAMRQRPLKK